MTEPDDTEAPSEPPYDRFDEATAARCGLWLDTDE